MKKVICPEPSCSGYRVHWMEPDTPRGPQSVEVTDDWPENRPAFCSWTCAILFGYISLKWDKTKFCSLCLTAGEEVVHSDDYKCWRAEEPKK